MDCSEASAHQNLLKPLSLQTRVREIKAEPGAAANGSDGVVLLDVQRSQCAFRSYHTTHGDAAMDRKK